MPALLDFLIAMKNKFISMNVISPDLVDIDKLLGFNGITIEDIRKGPSTTDDPNDPDRNSDDDTSSNKTIWIVIIVLCSSLFIIGVVVGIYYKFYHDRDDSEEMRNTEMKNMEEIVPSSENDRRNWSGPPTVSVQPSNRNNLLI